MLTVGFLRTRNRISKNRDFGSVSLVRFDSRFLVQNCPLLICPVAFEVAGEDRKVNGLRLVRNLCIFFCLI
jgi:hypothetical protein